jgi:hypothetical protein
MSQSKLETFFSINFQSKNKKCFIYDHTNKTAIFTNIPEPTDKFVIQKSGIRLYIRPSITQCSLFPKIDSQYSIPLLKSNLQKAIRRQHIDIAVTTALCLLQNDALALFRRLAIIYIEDVCLMDSYPIIIWFMMALKDYTLTNYDVNIILHIVINLCKEMRTYDFTGKPNPTNHALLEPLENYNVLLSLYYRSEYGGMKGDMNMLLGAIDYYSKNNEIARTYYTDSVEKYINIEIEILEESIDFHPFPHIISLLQKKTGLEKNIIKSTIWKMESGVNIRKSETFYKPTRDYVLITQYLEQIRQQLLL